MHTDRSPSGFKAPRFFHCVVPPGWEKKCGLGSYWKRTARRKGEKIMRRRSSMQSEKVLPHWPAPSYWKYWQIFFNRHGCVSCGFKKHGRHATHAGSGFC